MSQTASLTPLPFFHLHSANGATYRSPGKGIAPPESKTKTPLHGTLTSSVGPAVHSRRDHITYLVWQFSYGPFYLANGIFNFALCPPQFVNIGCFILGALDVSQSIFQGAQSILQFCCS
jgi:hypothetical protein